jgi:hypothetical protein
MRERKIGLRIVGQCLVKRICMRYQRWLSLGRGILSDLVVFLYIEAIFFLLVQEKALLICFGNDCRGEYCHTEYLNLKVKTLTVPTEAVDSFTPRGISTQLRDLVLI